MLSAYEAGCQFLIVSKCILEFFNHWFTLSSLGFFFLVIFGEAGPQLEPVAIPSSGLFLQPVCSQRAATRAQQPPVHLWIQVGVKDASSNPVKSCVIPQAVIIPVFFFLVLNIWTTWRRWTWAITSWQLLALACLRACPGCGSSTWATTDWLLCSRAAWTCCPL